jgi:hypothetical protein
MSATVVFFFISQQNHLEREREAASDFHTSASAPSLSSASQQMQIDDGNVNLRTTGQKVSAFLYSSLLY